VSLIDILDEAGITIPPEIRAVDVLTQYAVGPRYPGVSEVITQEEYQQALKLTREVLLWASTMINV
jgi:hypothetical protein